MSPSLPKIYLITANFFLKKNSTVSLDTDDVTQSPLNTNSNMDSAVDDASSGNPADLLLESGRIKPSENMSIKPPPDGRPRPKGPPPFMGTPKQQQILDDIDHFMKKFYNPIVVFIGLFGKYVTTFLHIYQNGHGKQWWIQDSPYWCTNLVRARQLPTRLRFVKRKRDWILGGGEGGCAPFGSATGKQFWRTFLA